MPFVKVIYNGTVQGDGLEFTAKDEPFELSDSDTIRLVKKGVVELVSEEESLEEIQESIEVPVDVGLEDLDLEEKVLDLLIDAGFALASEIDAATDEELTDIKGIGAGTLTKIRNAVKE